MPLQPKCAGGQSWKFLNDSKPVSRLIRECPRHSLFFFMESPFLLLSLMLISEKANQLLSSRPIASQRFISDNAAMSGSDLQALILLWNLFSGSIIGPFVTAMLFTLGFILHDALAESTEDAGQSESIFDRS